VVWVGIALAALAVAGAYFLGRSHIQRKTAENAAKVKDEQLRIANDRPRGRDDLARRVRDDF
jgi:hypothetical protein